MLRDARKRELGRFQRGHLARGDGLGDFRSRQRRGHEPLLLPALIEAHRGNAAGDGTVTRIIRGLIDSPVTDAERAGERLLVFGWQVASRDGKLRWTYRVVGEDSGRDLVEFTLAVPGCPSDMSRSRSITYSGFSGSELR